MIFILEMLGSELDQHNVIRCLSKPEQACSEEEALSSVLDLMSFS